jgi:hypothetical protein
MKGSRCEHLHLCPSLHRPNLKNGRIRNWMLEEIPEIVVGKGRRVNSFLN